MLNGNAELFTKYPGGRLAELYGGKWVLGLGILVTAVFTLLTPIAANTNFGLLIAVRVIEGEKGVVSEGNSHAY